MLRALIRAAGILALVGASAWAHAGISNSQMAAVLNKTSTNTVTATAGGAELLTGLLNQPRSSGITAGPDGSALLRDLLNGPGPRSPVPVGVTRTLPWAKMSKAIVRSLPGIATAVAVVELLEAVRCQEGFGGGPECDLGQPEQSTAAYTCGFGGQEPALMGSGASPYAACVDSAVKHTRAVNQGGYSIWYTYQVNTCNGNTCTGTGASECKWNSNQSSCGVNPPAPVSAVAAANGTIQACPAITVNGVQVVPAKDIDGKCPTGIYEPVPDAVAEERLNTIPPRSPAVAIAGELIERGIPVEHEAPSFDIEAAPQAERTITTTPDGDRTVVDKSWPWTIRNDGYGWSERIRTETYPPGVEIPPLAPDTPGGTITEGPGSGSGPASDIITCGLPNTPPCKIDETGTPTAGQYGEAEAKLAAGTAEIIEQINKPAPALPWLWGGIDMPSGTCSDITVDGPWSGIEGRTLDICGQPWVAWWRAALAWLMGLWAALHVYRLWQETVGT